MFTKSLEKQKNKQTEMNNTIERINSRITEAKEWISDLEDRMVEITAAKQVGKNIKVEKRDKRCREGAPSLEGSLKERSFQTPGNTLTAESVVSFGSTEGNITGRKNK